MSGRWLVSVFLAALIGAGSTAAAFLWTGGDPDPATPLADRPAVEPVACDPVACEPVPCAAPEPEAVDESAALADSPMRRRRPTREVLDPWADHVTDEDIAARTDPRPATMNAASDPSGTNTAMMGPEVLNPWE